MKQRRQSPASRKHNEMVRLLAKQAGQTGQDRQFVWAVYNSGDPIWNDSSHAIELVLFESKTGALTFVRGVLERQGVDVATLTTDDAVETAMWDDVSGRYLHLYELQVHPDDYYLLNVPF